MFHLWFASTKRREGSRLCRAIEAEESGEEHEDEEDEGSEEETVRKEEERNETERPG